MNKTLITLTIFSLFFLPAAVGSAAMTNGELESIDPATRKIVLRSTNPATGQPVRSEIWIQSNAAYGAGLSLESLKPGDSLWLEVRPDTEGNLRASKVTKS